MKWRSKYTCIALGAALLLPLCSIGASSLIEINLNKFWQAAERAGTGDLSHQKLELAAILNKKESLSTRQKLEQVNRYFDKWVTYQTDDIVWQQNDYWATPAEMLSKARGDCEDYAIAKYLFLRELGLESAQLRLIYVKARIGGRRSSVTQAHMVLGYYGDNNSEPLILDSLLADVLPASQRTDLTPVFSFNSQGIWSQGAAKSVGSPTARLSRWRNLLQKLDNEGINLKRS